MLCGVEAINGAMLDVLLTLHVRGVLQVAVLAREAGLPTPIAAQALRRLTVLGLTETTEDIRHRLTPAGSAMAGPIAEKVRQIVATALSV